MSKTLTSIPWQAGEILLSQIVNTVPDTGLGASVLFPDKLRWEIFHQLTALGLCHESQESWCSLFAVGSGDRVIFFFRVTTITSVGFCQS